MIDEMIREQLRIAEKRLAHCDRFIRHGLRALDDYESANDIEAARLTRQNLGAMSRIREARRIKCAALQRELSQAI